MANVKELEAKVRELQHTLEAHGIRPAVEPVAGEPNPDHIAFGSSKHAALLGLVEVTDEADKELYVTFAGAGGTTYRLADEYESVRTFPAMDPAKSAQVILRQKVGSLESGPPQVPEHAPPMWEPRDMQ